MRRRLEPSTAAWLGLGLLLAAGAIFILRENRATLFWIDEWSWAFERHGAAPDTWLDPHNEHLSLVPLAIYRLLFTTAGLDDYLPYRLVGLVAHLGCVVLLFEYVRRRVGDFLALLAAASLLLLGPAWQDILWPFQIGYLVSIAAGVGALLLLDRGDRGGDAGACALLALALASSGIGLAVAAGLVVEIALARRRPRDAWIVAAPLAVYGIWWLGYQDTELIKHNVVVAPGFVADAAAGVLSGLAGLGGTVIGENPQTLGWGRPLAVAALAVLAWRVARGGPVPARAASLATILLAFWFATALRRAQISAPVESRYVYVGAVFALLLAAELARGAALPRGAAALAAVVVALAILSNLGDMRDGGRFLREQADSARAVLGALELARPAVPPDHVATAFPGYPFVVVHADAYFDAAAQYGTPAATPAELESSSAAARAAADAELVAIHEPALRPAGSRPPLGRAPAVAGTSGGSLEERGRCIDFRAEPGSPPSLELTLPAQGVLLTAGAGPATVAVRRFADAFPEEPLATLPPATPALLRVAQDGSPRPWRLRLAPEGRVTACGLRGT